MRDGASLADSRRMRSLALGCLLVAIAGCDLYWDENPPPPPPPPPCEPPVANGPAQRDPSTGACEVATSCTCGACPEQPALGGDCSGPCEDLDEMACLATPACHAAYSVDAGSAAPVFTACWDIQPLAPLEG